MSGVQVSATSVVTPKIILVHGTWGRGFDPNKQVRTDEPRWFEPEGKFHSSLKAELSDSGHAADISAFPWSGANSIEGRRTAATALAAVVDQSVASAPTVPHFIVAHSHGGNVALDARVAMSNNSSNVHVVTLATPFLSIFRGAPRLFDKAFAVCLTICLLVSALWLAITSLRHGISLTLYAVVVTSLLSILFAVVTFVDRAYQKLTKRPLRWVSYNLVTRAARINNQSLLLSALVSGASAVLFGVESAVTIAFPIVLSILLVLRPLATVVNSFLHNSGYGTTGDRSSVPNLMILRSPRDEASLALVFGKLTSFIAQAASSISIIAPIAAALLVAVFAYFVAEFALQLFHKYQDCVANGRNCFIPSEVAVLGIYTVLDLAGKVGRYLAFGTFFCIGLVLLAALCKAVFARELLCRSMNASVDVYDTPDGSDAYRVTWCAPSGAGASGLRHSLYNNPDAVQKVATHIKEICAAAATGPVAMTTPAPHAAPRYAFLRGAAAVAATSTAYAVILSITYAPPGAKSSWCALNSYFEQAGPKGGFAILVAQFQGDKDAVAYKIAAEMKRRYGFPIVRTCMVVTMNAEDGSSERRILSRYKSSLVIWGQVLHTGEINVRVGSRYQPSDRPIVLAQPDVPDFVANRLQRFLFRAIATSVSDLDSKDPPANLAAYADQVETLLGNAKIGDASSSEYTARLDSLRQEIAMNAAAGRLMLLAAVANRDGSRSAKAVSRFERAASLRDGSEGFKSIIPNDWDEDYRFALLTDARLSKTERSAKLAASLYLKEYEAAVANRVAMEVNLSQKAGAAASAAYELFSINRSGDAANVAKRLACESLIRIAKYKEQRSDAERRDAELAKKGYQRGILPEVPIVKDSEAYSVLTRLDKNPAAIVARGTSMRLRDCERL